MLSEISESQKNKYCRFLLMRFLARGSEEGKWRVRVCVCIFCPLGWGLSSLTRNSTWATAVKALSSNHWTTREFQGGLVLSTEFVLEDEKF